MPRTKQYWKIKIRDTLEEYKNLILSEQTDIKVTQQRSYHRTRLISLSTNQELFEEQIEQLITTKFIESDIIKSINQNQITIISITLIIIGIVAIVLAIIIKYIINKRRRLNKRNNRPPQTLETELRRLDTNGPPQVITRIPGGGSNLRNEISYPQLPSTYY